MAERSLQETYAPGNTCFGCGPSNSQGLRIRSFVHGEEVVAEWMPEPYHEAFPGALNGGIIGTLLDCHSNWTAAWHLMRRKGADHPPCTVTAEYSIKMLRPTPTSGPVKLVAQVVDSKEDRAVVEAKLIAGGNEKKILSGLASVCRAHPAMALLQNFHKFFQKIPLNVNRVRAWYQMYQKHETSACRHFAAHLSHFKNLLVHSNSGLLCSALESLQTSVNVFCTEGRPALEGRILAERLSSTHHKVYLITDAAAFTVLPRVEMLAFGCDSITPRGIVNKIATSTLARIAKLEGKGSYFVATSEKVLDFWNDEFLLRQGPREEVYDGSASVQVENYYFDLTPPSQIRGVFLENGLTEVFAS